MSQHYSTPQSLSSLDFGIINASGHVMICIVINGRTLLFCSSDRYRALISHSARELHLKQIRSAVRSLKPPRVLRLWQMIISLVTCGLRPNWLELSSGNHFDPLSRSPRRNDSERSIIPALTRLLSDCGSSPPRGPNFESQIRWKIGSRWQCRDTNSIMNGVNFKANWWFVHDNGRVA